MSRPAGVAGVVLAAGGGSRFADGAKMLADFRGHPVVWWAASCVLGAGLERCWVVQGAVDLAGALPDGVEVIANPAWRDGQASSLQAALARAGRAGVEAVVVGLGDQPLVPASAWEAVAASGADLAVATYGGRRRNPVRLGAPVWHLLPRSGDEGARALMRARPELVTEVPCVGEPADIDTREDLIRWS